MPTRIERKSTEARAFEHYLRTGRRLVFSATQTNGERKFNPWHDPENGQFTDARTAAAPAPKPTISQTPRAPRAAPSEPPKPRGWREGGVMPVSRVEAHADHAMAQYHENRRRGMTHDEAAAWAANSEIESGGDHRSRQMGGGPGRGIYQWGSDKIAFDRRRDFLEVMGVPIERSTREQQFRFRDHELSIGKEMRKKPLIDAAQGAGDKAYAIAVRYLRPYEAEKRGIERANLAEAILRRALARRQQAQPRPQSKPPARSVFLPIVY